MAGLGFLGTTLACGAFIAFYPTLMLHKYHFPLTFSGMVLAMNWFAQGISCFAIGRIATDWQRRSKILSLFGFLMPCTYIVMVLTDVLPLLLIASVINGIAWGFFPILLTVSFNLRRIRTREVPIGHAFMFTAFSLGLAAGQLKAILCEHGETL